MAGFLSVTNWGEYQHYRDRTPIWVKFYVEILHDDKLKKLPVSTRLLWDQMLLLAAMFQNSIPNSPDLISELTGLTPEQCGEGITELLKGRWLREKTTRRAASKQPQAQSKKKEKEKEENARKQAVQEAAERFVKSCAYYSGDDELRAKLASEFSIVDDVTVRRLLTVAALERSAA